jgi:hypothetical protein
VIVRFQQSAKNGTVQCVIAFATPRGNNYVCMGKKLVVPLEPGVIQRETRRISTDQLPRPHLSLIRFSGDLPFKVECNERMDDVWREHSTIRASATRIQRFPVSPGAFGKAGYDPNPGDPYFARRPTRGAPSAHHHRPTRSIAEPLE